MSRVSTNTAADMSGGDDSGPGAERRSRWIRAALAYVPHVARRYAGYGLPFDELLAAGNLGLVMAALRFEPSREVKFITYADWWIRKAILKALEEQSGAVRLPRYRQEQLRSLRETSRQWRRTNGRDPDAEQLAKATGLTAREVEKLQSLGQHPVSLEDPALPGNERPLRDMLVAEARNPQDKLIRRDLVWHVRGLVEELSAREREVVHLRFGFGADREPMTLRQVGRALGISRERVRQIERRALLHLRSLL